MQNSEACTKEVHAKMKNPKGVHNSRTRPSPPILRSFCGLELREVPYVLRGSHAVSADEDGGIRGAAHGRGKVPGLRQQIFFVKNRLIRSRIKSSLAHRLNEEDALVWMGFVESLRSGEYRLGKVFQLATGRE